MRLITARGPGTVIKQTLAAWGINEHTGCGCTDLANEMDQVGVDIVEKNLSVYTNRMIQSIKDWKASGNFVQRNIPAPPSILVVGLIQYGIDKSREEVNAARFGSA